MKGVLAELQARARWTHRVDFVVPVYDARRLILLRIKNIKSLPMSMLGVPSICAAIPGFQLLVLCASTHHVVLVARGDSTVLLGGVALPYTLMLC